MRVYFPHCKRISQQQELLLSIRQEDWLIRVLWSEWFSCATFPSSVCIQIAVSVSQIFFTIIVSISYTTLFCWKIDSNALLSSFHITFNNMHMNRFMVIRIKQKTKTKKYKYSWHLWTDLGITLQSKVIFLLPTNGKCFFALIKWISIFVEVKRI